jgi:uncharacterized protein (UPF0548 family)
MFNMRWMRLYWPTTPIRVGANVAILVHHFGFYWLNAARIVYVVNEDGPISQYGFRYGTLAEHAERGKERFTVEWHRSDGTVWYTILAFSRPPEDTVQAVAEASKAAMLVATGASE